MTETKKTLLTGVAVGTVIGVGLSVLIRALTTRKTEKKHRTDLVFGGVEGGGTTVAVTFAEGEPTNVVSKKVIDTTTPKETLALVRAELGKRKIDALGVAYFGPVDLNPKSKTYGFVTSCPKPGWQYTDVVSPFRDLGVPIGFSTDVNAPAMAEVRYGQHGDIRSCAYVTVGTGIGVGVVVDGKPLTGALHPEGGHIRFPRYPGDSFKGTCPFHADCCEGMANNHAVAAKAGVDAKDLASLPDSHPVWDSEAYYLAQLCAAITMLVSPEVIVIGGGLLKRKCLFPKIRAQFVAINNKYLRAPRIDDVEKYIVPSIFNAPGAKGTAGSVGALTLALDAFESKSS